MVGSPYLLPALFLALVACAFKNFYQAICYLLVVVYVVDELSFYVASFMLLGWTVFGRLRAAVSGD